MADKMLFEDLPYLAAPVRNHKVILRLLWTEQKAKLVAEYLKLFVFITKHGCYIDGFAGPKKLDLADSWAAELVLNSEPRLLRELFLCDQGNDQIEHLQNLKARQPIVAKRSIEVVKGDFNETVREILGTGVITPRKATFCLLDQFSTECHWATVQALARHKQGEEKIELFYFLASGWINRALAAFTRNLETPQRWWGRPDWKEFGELPSLDQAIILSERFKTEFGYKHATPWPIFDRSGGRRLMFHMIHATDHDEAPKLMHRAYNRVTRGRLSEQFKLPLEMVEAIRRSFDEGVE